MTELSPEEATQIARASAGLDPLVDARAYHVKRLDRGGNYYLVVFRKGEDAGTVISVHAETGRVLSSAVFSAGGSPITIDAGRAIALAGLGDTASAELTWQPCRASLSPAYPFWEIRLGEKTVFVDQAGTVWRQLEPAAPGG